MRKDIILSAFVVVRNEESQIERCLKSLDFCDEIILVDQQSTDDTVRLARKYTDKIYSDKVWGVAEPSREMASRKCRGKWLLNLDGDEEILTPLKKEILKAIQSDEYDAYEIHRNFYYMGGMLKHIGESDWVVRLHKKGKVDYPKKLHHCTRPKKDIKIKRLKNSINHYPYISLKQQLERSRRYAKIQADTYEDYRSFPKKYLGILYTPIGYFLYYYIFKKGFLDGSRGLLFSCMGFHHELWIYRYLWFR